MKQALIYSLKVWITVVVLGSSLAVLFSGIEEFLIVTLFFMYFSLEVVLPLWLVFTGLSWYFTTRLTSLHLCKWFLSLVTVLMITSSCVFLIKNQHKVYIMIGSTVGYSIAGLIAIWFYKLEPVNNANQSPINIV